MPNFTDPELGIVYDKVVEIGDALTSHIRRDEGWHDDLTARIGAAEAAIAAKDAANGAVKVFGDEMREQHSSCFAAMSPLREQGTIETVLRTTRNAAGVWRWVGGIFGAILASIVVSGLTWYVAHAATLKAVAEQLAKAGGHGN